MSQHNTQAESQAQPGGGGKKKKLVWIVVCLLSIVGGAATPLAFGVNSHGPEKPKKKKPAAEHEMATIPFGDVTVNLADARMQRYLRVKIVLMVDAEDLKDVTKVVEKCKPSLKSWLIGHIAGKKLTDIGGSVGVKRMQREIQEYFEEKMFPDGEGKPFEVLFEEYVVQ